MQLPKFLFFICSAFFCFSSAASEAKQEIRIAVLYTEDPLFFINTFAPTIDFLRKRFPQYRITTQEITELQAFDKLKTEDFSFLLSPAGVYASFDPTSEGLRQIAARTSPFASTASESVASVLITSAHRSDITSLKDIQGKRIAIRDPNSLSGWLGAKGVLRDHLSEKDLEGRLINTQYRFPDVYSYLESDEADVAVIPACELESLIERGLISGDKYRIIGEKPSTLACKVSSSLYPDFVFSSFPHASPEIVKDFTVALLTMPKMPDSGSWGIANDFRSVLRLFRKLEIGPYKPQPFSLFQLVSKYKTEAVLALALLLGLIFHIYRTNSLVLQRTSDLRKAIEQRDSVAEIARASLKRLNLMERRGILSQLSNMFAHELKQPLSTVVNYCNGLKMYGESVKLDPILSESIEAISSETQKAAAIVDRVRSYAKSTPPVSSEAKADLSEAIRKAINAFRLYVSTQCRLNVDIPESCMVTGDPLELEILVLNLLRNASDAVEPLGKDAQIKVEVKQTEAGCTLNVKDNGPPVTSDVVERMRRALQASIKTDGLGLGLMIVHAIIERHRADINIQQLKPQGISISVTFKGADS